MNAQTDAAADFEAIDTRLSNAGFTRAEHGVPDADADAMVYARNGMTVAVIAYYEADCLDCIATTISGADWTAELGGAPGFLVIAAALSEAVVTDVGTYVRSSGWERADTWDGQGPGRILITRRWTHQAHPGVAFIVRPGEGWDVERPDCPAPMTFTRNTPSRLVTTALLAERAFAGR